MTHTEADLLGGCIRTASGRLISLTAPRQEDIVLDDIAHALALTNRYGGHTPEPWSVAQHSVLVSHLCSPQDALDGLFHDAPEAYLGDLVAPLKHLPELVGFCSLEDYVLYPAIARRFALSPVVPVEVKWADHLAYKLEVCHLFGEKLQEEWELRSYAKHQHLLGPWGWRLAQEEFLERYHELTAGRLG